MNYSPKKMQELLSKNGFNFKKMFGQNFIIDENIIQSIIRKADIDKDTLVLEIGPGAGSLTYLLSDAAKEVVCLEIDTNLKPILEDVLKDKQNVSIYFEDFLKANVQEVLEEHSYKKLYVVANLPYYITTPIVMKIIEDKIPVDRLVIMVQKEVGDRFKATPGSKDYSSLSVFLNYYFDITKLLDVSRNVFLPKPNVDSIVIQMKRKEILEILTNEQFFFQLIRSSFHQKRKTLRNNLRSYDLVQIEEVLRKFNLDLNVRAEQIPIHVFVEIANSYNEKRP